MRIQMRIRKTWAISSSAVSSERAPSRTVTVAIGSLLSARSTNELRPADIGEDQIQGTRVRLLLGEWTPEDTFAVALAVDRDRICVTQAEIRREPLPFRFGPGQDFFCLMYCREKSLGSGGIAAGPIAVEGVTDDRDRSLRPEATYDVFHRNRTAEPSVLELGAKIPVGQGRVCLSLERLLRQQRRRTVDDDGLLSKIDACAQRKRLEQKPALVERTARDGELLVLEVEDAADRRLRRCHHRAKRGRSRIKHECIAKRALASNPQPIGENEVDRAALERHLARFGRCKLAGIDDKVKFPFNAVPFDDVKFPRQGSGLLHGDANAISLGNCGPKHNDGNQPKTQHGPHRATMP